jgi:hypothetical protein
MLAPKKMTSRANPLCRKLSGMTEAIAHAPDCSTVHRPAATMVRRIPLGRESSQVAAGTAIPWNADVSASASANSMSVRPGNRSWVASGRFASTDHDAPCNNASTKYPPSTNIRSRTI